MFFVWQKKWNESVVTGHFSMVYNAEKYCPKAGEGKVEKYAYWFHFVSFTLIPSLFPLS